MEIMSHGIPLPVCLCRCVYRCVFGRYGVSVASVVCLWSVWCVSLVGVALDKFAKFGRCGVNLVGLSLVAVSLVGVLF